ncbi:MAG: hypothetical protein Q4G48_01015 [Bacteroidia bacterium]|nr:hypothetical protein [Bacteroidia bacterium]
MKKLFFLILLSILFFGCDDNYEITHKYSRTISQSKQYPVYLDMSENRLSFGIAIMFR